VKVSDRGSYTICHFALKLCFEKVDLSDWMKTFCGLCMYYCIVAFHKIFNPLNAKLNPICHLLALLGDRHILHVSRIRVKKTEVVYVNRII